MLVLDLAIFGRLLDVIAMGGGENASYFFALKVLKSRLLSTSGEFIDGVFSWKQNLPRGAPF